jgi:hypothetical protein
MIDELLQIVLDPIYPPNEEYYNSKRVKPKNFEIIYSEGNFSNVDYIRQEKGTYS